MSYNFESKIFSGENLPEVFHPDILIGDLLLHHFRLSPERIVQINADDGVEINGEQMTSLMKKIAIFLKNQGLTFGDVVGVCASNTSYLTPAVFGCLLLGLPIATVTTFFDVNQLVLNFQRTQPKLIFCDSDQVEKIQKAMEILKIGRKIVVLTDDVENYINVRTILAAPETFVEFPYKFNGVSSDKVCAVILSTSGSTGKSKLSRVSHAQLSQSNFSINGLKGDSITLNFSSVAWISGFRNMVHAVLNQQSRLITSKGFQPKLCVEMIARYNKFTVILSLIPPYLASLEQFMQTDENKKDWLSPIKILTLGGGFAPLRIIESMERFLSNGRVQLIYAMTETCGAISRGDLRDSVSSSVGKLLPNTHAKIFTAAGTLGGIGDAGEILLKRPFNIIDYLNDEQQTRAFIDDSSWMHTGDVGYFDENLNLHIVGRTKFMMRCRNHQVSPMEIEEVISIIPGVLHVCVASIFDMFKSNLPVAVIQRSPMYNLTRAEVHEAVNRLEDYKHLYGGVLFVDDIPMTATGKLDRISVAQMVTAIYHRGESNKFHD